MKSIRKFRRTRQALKQVPPTPPQPASGDPDEQVELTLGPRLFRKRETRRGEPDEHLTIEERTAAEQLNVEYRAIPAPGLGRLEPLPSETEVVKIIPESDWQAGEGQVMETGAPIPDSSTEDTTGQPGQDWSDEGGSPGAGRPSEMPEAGVGETPVQLTDDGSFGQQPVVMPPGDPGPADPRIEQAAQPDTHDETEALPTAEPTKGPRARTPADQLSRYAMKVGTHSYVLIDDEGHPVKKSRRPKQK